LLIAEKFITRGSRELARAVPNGNNAAGAFDGDAPQ
jgi:hypothetical protein